MEDSADACQLGGDYGRVMPIDMPDTEDGMTPFALACQEGKLDCAEYWVAEVVGIPPTSNFASWIYLRL